VAVAESDNLIVVIVIVLSIAIHWTDPRPLPLFILHYDFPVPCHAILLIGVVVVVS
jgi:hypothetical protein